MTRDAFRRAILPLTAHPDAILALADQLDRDKGVNSTHPLGGPACRDCGLLYSAVGWCDCVIPHDVWNRIAPEGGVLCLHCMAARLEAAGLGNVPLQVTSGPFLHDPAEAWQRGFERGREQALADQLDREPELQEVWAARINAEVSRRLVERGLPPDAARVVIVPDGPEARRRDQIIEDACRRGLNEPAPKLPAFSTPGNSGAGNT